MKPIKPSNNPQQWPNRKVESVPCPKHSLVIKIADWTKDPGEPAYDVECYIGGVYSWGESKSFTLSTMHGDKNKAKLAALMFAQIQIEKLL